VGYIYILATVLFTTYGQLVVKWRVNRAGIVSQSFLHKAVFLLSLVLDPWVISSLVSAFLAFFCWLLALSKFDLSFSYPFMSLAFILVLAASALFFREPLTVFKICGILLVILGIIVGSR
jgi:multidrug transporter EmrE-like cation transporter